MKEAGKEKRWHLTALLAVLVMLGENWKNSIKKETGNLR
jgi:hypothetical protein